MKRAFFNFCVAFVAVLVLSGCMKLGPDYHRPDTGIEVPASYQHVPAETTIVEPEDHWWRVFSNPELNELVEDALKNNLDIRRATAVVLEVSRGEFAPAIALSIVLLVLIFAVNLILTTVQQREQRS